MNILFFDYWPNGAHLIDVFLKNLPNINVTKKTLIHIDSFIRKNPHQFYLKDDIEIYDISYFKGENLSEIIDKFKPSIIFITNIKLFERIICLNANKKNIPVYYFIHGNIFQVTKKVNLLNKICEITNSFYLNIKLIPRYTKIYYKFYYPQYIILRKNLTKFKIFLRLFSFTFNKLINRFYDFDYIDFSSDFYIDKAFVYSFEDIKFLKSTKVQILNYHVCGNPELITKVNSYKNKWKVRKQILLIDDGFGFFNLYGLNHNTLSSLYKKIYETIRNDNKYKNYDFVLKIKSQEQIDYESLNFPFKVERNKDIYQCIQESELIIGTHSTAILFAIVENKPILILNSNEYKKVPDLYFKNGIGIHWDNLDKLPNTDQIDYNNYYNYISENNILGQKNIIVREKNDFK